MTSSQAETNINNEITATEVANYLKQHGDFFQQHPDLLSTLDLSDKSKGSISLVERQMKGLRQRNKDTELELQQVIRNAQDNQNLLQQTISLTLHLLPAENIEQLIDLIYQQLSTLFDIQYSNLLLSSEYFSHSEIDLTNIRKTLGDNFPKQQPVCGRLKSTEKQCLFNEHENVNSAAILPLGENGELGLLVLGSEDQTHFDPAMGDLFLLLISDMLSKLLSRFTK